LHGGLIVFFREPDEEHESAPDATDRDTIDRDLGLPDTLHDDSHVAAPRACWAGMPTLGNAAFAMDLLGRIVGMILLRPYVFVFFAVYLVAAVTRMGWRRTAVFSLIAYVVAFAA
jgi:hypothetical protein